MHCEFRTVEQLGALCRKRREALGLRIEDAAMATGANYRWISEVERGKATAQFGKVLHYAAMLGIRFAAVLPDESSFEANRELTL